MNKFELMTPCHFGLEAVLKREIFDLGYDILEVEDGRVTFEGDAEAICQYQSQNSRKSPVKSGKIQGDYI